MWKASSVVYYLSFNEHKGCFFDLLSVHVMLVLRLCRFKSLIICLRMVAGDPDALVKVAGRNDSALEGWAENEHLQLLNLTYVFLSESLPLELQLHG